MTNLESSEPGNPEASEKPPQQTSRPPVWADVPDEAWNDWRWQLRHRLSTVDELRQLIDLTPEEEEGARAQHRFRLDLTPYFASLIEPQDPPCLIRRHVIPTAGALRGFEAAMVDSLSERWDCLVSLSGGSYERQG